MYVVIHNALQRWNTLRLTWACDATDPLQLPSIYLRTVLEPQWFCRRILLLCYSELWNCSLTNIYNLWKSWSFCIISEENDMAVLVTWTKVAGSYEMSRQRLTLSTTWKMKKMMKHCWSVISVVYLSFIQSQNLKNWTGLSFHLTCNLFWMNCKFIRTSAIDYAIIHVQALCVRRTLVLRNMDCCDMSGIRYLWTAVVSVTTYYACMLSSVSCRKSRFWMPRFHTTPVWKLTAIE